MEKLMEILNKIKNNRFSFIFPNEIEEYLKKTTDIYNDPILIETVSSKNKYEVLLMPILKKDYNQILSEIKINFNEEKYFKSNPSMLNEDNIIYGFKLKKKIELLFENKMPIDCKWYINYLKSQHEGLLNRKLDLSFFPSISNFNHDFEWSKGLSLKEKNMRINFIKTGRGSIVSSNNKHYIYINLKEYYKAIMTVGMSEANFDLLNTFFHELTHAKQNDKTNYNSLDSYKLDKSTLVLNFFHSNNKYNELYEYFYPFAYHEYDARVNGAILAKEEIKKYNFRGKEKLIQISKNILLYNTLFLLNQATEDMENYFDDIAHTNKHYGYPSAYHFEYDESWKRRSLSDFMNNNYNYLNEEHGSYILQRIIVKNDASKLKEDLELISEQHKNIVLKVIKEKIKEINVHKDLTISATEIPDMNSTRRKIAFEKLIYLESLEQSFMEKNNALQKEQKHELHHRK
jgi:hypothetical protein